MRKFVLVSYDVADDKRLRKIFNLLRGYGEHVQYSIFLCQLTEKDQVVLIEKIRDIVHHTEDQTILITLGPVDGKRDALPKFWKVIGQPLAVADHSVMIY